MDDDREQEGAREGNLTLRSARLLQLLFVGLLAASLPYFLPGVSDAARQNFGVYGVGVPAIVASMIAVEWARRASGERADRRFWLLVNAALGCWLANWVLMLALGDAYWLPAIQFLVDLLNLAYYGFLLSAAVVRPDLRRWAMDGALHRLRFTVAMLLLLVLVLYFIVIPAQLGDGSYFSHDPALFTYVGFDLLLLLVFAALWRAHRNSTWATVYGLMALTSAAWMTLDSVEAAMWRDWIPYLNAGTPWDLVWLVPYAPMVLAAQVYVAADVDESEEEPEEIDPAPRPESAGPSLLIASIALLPMAHIAISATWAGDPVTRQARDVLILVAVLVMATLALVAQRRFESLRAISADVLRDELERRRGAEARSAAAVERDRRFIARMLDGEVTTALTDAAFALVQLKRRNLDREEPGLDEIGALVVRSRRQVHDLAQILEPAPGEKGFSGALRSALEEYRRQTGVDVRIEGDTGDAPVPAQVRMAILCFVREALDRIAQPSTGAARVKLGLWNAALRVELTCGRPDEGAPAATPSGACIDRVCGIVEEVGGRIEVGATPEAGVHVIAEIPLPV